MRVARERPGTTAGRSGLAVSTAAGRFADTPVPDAARRRVARTARRCACAGGGCAPEKPEPPVREIARGRGTR